VNRIPSEKRQDRQVLARLNKIAAGIFARNGVDFTLAKRTGGWTNVTWLAGGLALRLSARQGDDRIRREARLAALLGKICI
jgi:scyllo-inosamine 4-kinase